MRSLIPIVVMATACSETGLTDSEGARSPSDASTTDTASSTSPPELSVVPDDYAISGVVEIVGGEWGPATELTLTTYGAGVDPGDVEELCAGPLIVAADPAPPPTDEPISAWWSLSVNAVDSACEPPPELLSHLGFGAYDARLDAGVAAQGLQGATPFGLYVQAGTPDAPVWIVGVVGSDAQLAGEELPDLEAPLPDGVYHLAAVVLTPWPPL